MKKRSLDSKGLCFYLIVYNEYFKRGKVRRIWNSIFIRFILFFRKMVEMKRSSFANFL